MRNIILSFFILVIFSNVKAASVQNQGNNSPQSIGYASVAQPTVTFDHDEKSHTQYLDIIKNIFRDESENMKYSYKGSIYHWVITDFYIYIDNSDRKLKKKFSNKKTEAFIKGSAYFIAYIKDIIKYLISQNMHTYNFETNTHEKLNNFAKDFKKLIYDEFDQDLKKDLIKYESERKNEKYHKMAKEILEVLVHSSSMRIKGYFIKIRKDGNYMDLNQEDTFYFNIAMHKDKYRLIHNLQPLNPEVAELITTLTRKE